MRDDFSALDLFSAGKKPAVRKKLLGLPRRKIRGTHAKDPLTDAFLPLIVKMKKKQTVNFTLQGWPVSLKWSAPRSNEREDYSAFF
jgi:hypothetical protein